MSNIIVFGGAGYCGAVLAPRLLDAGHKVTIFDTFWYGKNIFDEAKDYMEKAHSIKPNLPELNNNLGLVYLNLNEIEKAIKYFQKAISLNKNYLNLFLTSHMLLTYRR